MNTNLFELGCQDAFQFLNNGWEVVGKDVLWANLREVDEGCTCMSLHTQNILLDKKIYLIYIILKKTM